jgi:hypothetical protein
VNGDHFVALWLEEILENASILDEISATSILAALPSAAMLTPSLARNASIRQKNIMWTAAHDKTEQLDTSSIPLSVAFSPMLAHLHSNHRTSSLAKSHGELSEVFPVFISVLSLDLKHRCLAGLFPIRCQRESVSARDAPFPGVQNPK